MDETCAASLAGDHGAITFTDWSSAVRDADADLVIVSTTHDVLSAVSVNALQAGCHVLCEKPLGRDRDEVARSVDAAAAADRVLRAGYNHRFHPAIAGLHAVASQGRLGPLISVRGRYGHGGRPGYDREWRADPAISGGGELLDQGRTCWISQGGCWTTSKALWPTLRRRSGTCLWRTTPSYCC